jgi:hypothetical protein
MVAGRFLCLLRHTNGNVDKAGGSGLWPVNDGAARTLPKAANCGVGITTPYFGGFFRHSLNAGKIGMSRILILKDAD